MECSAERDSNIGHIVRSDERQLLRIRALERRSRIWAGTQANVRAVSRAALPQRAQGEDHLISPAVVSVCRAGLETNEISARSALSGAGQAFQLLIDRRIKVNIELRKGDDNLMLLECVPDRLVQLRLCWAS